MNVDIITVFKGIFLKSQSIWISLKHKKLKKGFPLENFGPHHPTHTQTSKQKKSKTHASSWYEGTYHGATSYQIIKVNILQCHEIRFKIARLISHHHDDHRMNLAQKTTVKG